MQHFVQDVTGHFIDKLPEGRDYFALEELQDLGFPDFLVQRISLELENNLADSIVPPKSDWADMDSESVVAAWEHFLYAINEAIRLPSAYARSVVETAIEDVLDLLVQPRINIPEYLFGPDKDLSYEEVQERCETIVVYRHFAAALPRYMQKRELEVLSLEKARTVISQLDERFTAHFTALNWAQHFQPLFDLMGDKLDPELFRLFFKDRGDAWNVKLFDQALGEIDRSKLIELLSQPRMEMDDEIIEPEPEPEQSEPTFTLADTFKEQTSDETILEESVETEPDSSSETDLIEESESQKTWDYDEIAEEDDDAISLEELEKSDLADEQKQDEREPEQTQEASAETDLSWEFDEEQQVEESETERKEEEAAELEDEASIPPIYERFVRPGDQDSGPDTSPGGKPLWQQFLSEASQVEDDAELNKSFSAEQEEPSPSLADSLEMEDDLDDPLDVKPIIDLEELEQESEETDSNAARLRYHLSDMKDAFIEEIFGGEQSAFDEAIDELAEFDDWPMAGKYIAGELFRINMVEMYSEIAVEFTDRVQTYFLERKG